MPELPEVETTVRGLQEKVLGQTIVSVWSDWKKQIKQPNSFKKFEQELLGRKIEKAERRGKNIVFILSGDKFLLIHQKMTGHLLVGRWKNKGGKWFPESKGPLEDKFNRYIHLIFELDSGQMLALSDLRKFAKVEVLDKAGLERELKDLGPDPLANTFSFDKFLEVLRQTGGKIKEVLMRQNIIAGIGNIYSNEILWEARVSPFKKLEDLKEKDLKKIFNATKKALKRATRLKGTSISDYRTIEGKRGSFERELNVYQQEGRPCSRCGKGVKRKMLGGRSVFFCPDCQK